MHEEAKEAGGGRACRREHAEGDGSCRRRRGMQRRRFMQDGLGPRDMQNGPDRHLRSGPDHAGMDRTMQDGVGHADWWTLQDDAWHAGGGVACKMDGACRGVGAFRSGCSMREEALNVGGGWVCIRGRSVQEW